MALYDGFHGDQPDPAKWVIGEIRNGDQLIWRYDDDNMRVSCADSRCTIDIPEFSSSHDHVPMFDNPKALYVSTQTWELGDDPIRFSTSMACELFNGDASDYRNGFASFNVLDFASGTVMDVIMSGEKVWAILEQLALPGVETAVPPFTDVIDLGVNTAPGQEHEVAVEYDPRRHSVRWYVDGQLQLTRDTAMDPKSLQLAFGIITLHPLSEQGSTSLRGQGAKASWGPFHVDEGSEMEPGMSPSAGVG